MAEREMNTLIKDLYEKKSFILDAEGKRTDKQHKKGKLTARERINIMLDEGTFVETDMFVRHRCDNFGMEKQDIPAEGVVTGYGHINGRLVYLFSQDFTAFGGSLGEMHAMKITKIQDMAMKTGAPLIGINDSGGARIQEGVDSLHGYGRIFYRNTRASGVIPQLSVIVGPCAGGAVYSPALTDFVFMVNKVSQMYITGPSIIKAVTAEDISPEELGGAYTHNSIAGNGHFIYENEVECFQNIRTLLSFLPSNNLEDPPFVGSDDDVNRKDEELNTLVPTNTKMPYDVRELIKKIVDNYYFFETMPLFAQNMVVGFARIGGMSIGIIANQPNVLAGCLDINAADKAARFIRFCDCFNIPMLTIVDTPGFLPGKNQEYGGIIRHGAKMLYAYSEASVPMINLTVRKSYGGASVGMCNKDLGADYVVAWPQAEIAVMGADGAVPLIFKREIDGSPDPVAKKKELIDKYEKITCNPYEAAKRGLCDFVITPESTRPYLASLFSTLRTKRSVAPNKKHGNIPL